MHAVVHIHCIGVGHIYRGHGRLSLQHAGNDVKSCDRRMCWSSQLSISAQV